MIITHKIKMDLDRYSVPGFDAVCGDRYTRELEIALYAGGVAWEIPDGAAVTVRYQKPDGTAGAYDLLPDGSGAWRVSGNVVTVTVAPQALTVPGCVILTVCLSAGEREISTFQILMNVRSAVGMAETDSGDYWYLSGSLPQTENAVAGEFLVVDSVDSQGRVTGLKTAALEIPETAGLTADQVSAIMALLKLAAYTEDPTGAWTAFRTAFGLDSMLIPATGVTLSAARLSFKYAGAQRLTAVLEPADTTDALVWTTSNARVATVRDGLVTPVGNGNCIITASAGAISSSCAVSVAFAEERVTYGVSYKLTNVTCSESVAEIAEGDSFTADIIANAGYMLDTVTVTMGGVDITDDAVTYDMIVIGSVTGEIVITATGVAAGGEEHTHSYTAAVTTAATCTAAGVRTYTCSCGDSYTEAIAATGHNYANGVCANCGAADPDYEEPVTLTGISAVYSGGSVTVGTSVDDLTGLAVTAAYSDGSTAAVTDYTLSGTIAEGSNTITVSYGGKTATFTVTGVAQMYDIEWVPKGGYYKAGVLTQYSGVYNTGLVAVGDATKLYFKFGKSTNYYIAYFDSAENYISQDGNWWQAGEKTFVFPDGAAYFAPAYYESDLANVEIKVNVNQVRHLITTNLTNATINTAITNVIDGSVFSATVTPAAAGALKVTATMGGVDISASAVTDDYICIDQVTGDVVITAEVVTV